MHQPLTVPLADGGSTGGESHNAPWVQHQALPLGNVNGFIGFTSQEASEDNTVPRIPRALKHFHCNTMIVPVEDFILLSVYSLFLKYPEFSLYNCLVLDRHFLFWFIHDFILLCFRIGVIVVSPASALAQTFFSVLSSG